MRGRIWCSLVLALALAAAGGPARAGAVLDPREAPDWKVSQWINGDPGPLGGHKGRVVVIHFFQLWCPASINFSIPAMQHFQELWGDRDDFLLVSIHSVFEGHPFQTPEVLRTFVQQHGMKQPVGVDAYDPDDATVPVTMKRFHALGTPHLAIIDRDGNYVFSHFGEFDVPAVEFFIERLLKQESELRPVGPKPRRVADTTLSGRYDLHYAQVSKTCGPLEPPRDMEIRIEVQKDTIDADFPYRFMGLEGLSLRYDPRAFAFEGVLEHAADVRGDHVTAEAKIRGNWVLNSSPPKLEYEVIFQKQSANPSWNCNVRARGTAVRTGD